MKKIMIVICIIILVLVLRKDDSIVIPKDAIRFRIIANSNTLNDQVIKNNMAINLENYIGDIIKDENEVNDILLNNYNNINNHIQSYLNENNINLNYDLKIGKNYFPKKEYKGITYEEGYYDSIVVNLGNAKGMNWWCIIYPPLCLIKDDVTSTEYTTIVKEMLNNL